MPTNFWLEWAEVGGEIEASLTPSEAKSFTRMLRTRARGRPGSSWSEKASGASFECLLEESAGSPSASSLLPVPIRTPMLFLSPKIDHPSVPTRAVTCSAP